MDLTGNTSSCGCLQKERTHETNKLRPFESLFNRLRTTSNRPDDTLTYEEFISFTNKSNCFYCNDILIWNDSSKFGYNLDRINSSLGYSVENCVPCCPDCNWLKNDQSLHEFLTRIRKIEKHMRGK